MSTHLKNVSILIVSVTICAILAELALRYVPRREPANRVIPVNETLLASLYERFVNSGSGIERSWFYSVPETLSSSLQNLKHPPGIPPSTFLTKKQIFELGSNYPTVYNYELVRQELCNDEKGFFQRYPFDLYVFQPDFYDYFPPFRYFPNAKYISGLITNSLGFRSPEIEILKPESTIRLAFVGASTTVNHPLIGASYPEYIGHWLNLWSKKKRARDPL